MIRAGLAALALFGAGAAEAATSYIQTGRLIDVEAGRVLTGQCVTVTDARITAIARCGQPPKGATLIDWRGYTVLPGLIDLHTHIADVGQSADVAEPIKKGPAETAFIGARNARDTLMAGFTSARDVGTFRVFGDVKLRDAINSGLVPGPRMAVVGTYLTIPGGGGEINGLPEGSVPPEMRFGVVRTPEEAAAKAEALFAGGADFLKLIATGAVLAIGTEPGQPELTEDEMRAAVRVAQAHGSYATAHAHGAAGIKAAIRAGARSIEHASLIDDEGLALAKATGVWLVMDVYNGDYIDDIGTKEGWPAEYLRKNRETTDIQRAMFKKAVAMGVPLAFGTDSGVYPHGLNARQFAYMVRLGMTPMQAIQSATRDAARLMMREKDVGAITPGRYGDMIAVKGDPLADIRTLERVAGVIKGGVLIR
ncbi:MAG: amidohydrolase family protein [Chakrabartia sp.]